MKKTLSAICGIVLCTLAINAQAQEEGKNRSFLGFNIGVALPGDEYGASDLKESGTYSAIGDGNANTGAIFNVEGAGFFIPYLGLGGKLGIFANQLDGEQYADDYFAFYYGDNFPASTATYAEGEDGVYYSVFGMVGPYVSLPISRFSLDANFLVGYSINAQAEKHAKAFDANGNQVGFQKYDKQNESAFITDLGFGIRFFASDALAIKLGVDFLNAKPEYTNRYQLDREIGTEGDELEITATTEEERKLTTITLGLAFTL